ncbi:MAG: large conductance mechanosensitive channel protein MscL [Janthinobacterium lividum]
MSTMTEFRDFVLRGNVVDLAVGVVIGGAFGTIVKALIADLITPLIGIFFANPKKPVSFDQLHFTIHGSQFLVGDFLNNVVAFLLISAVVFIFVVKPVNHLMSLRKVETPAATTHECPECLSSIPVKATRCAFCTAQVTPA